MDSIVLISNIGDSLARRGVQVKMVIDSKPVPSLASVLALDNRLQKH